MVTISIDCLYPHPQNPRQDVGDISELTESIKANGVYQNLTVVRGGAGVPDGAEGYTVIIGHRRLAAAKAAGLTELPCSVVEMSDKQQAATMLLENMQRADLTVYEQAQGFQTMLDFGATEAEISEQTGLSKTTVKHRLKLLELDPEEFRKSQERQPTMADYIELEKIKDTKARNEALKEIGTSNFKWTVAAEIRKQEQASHRKEWFAFIRTTGLKKLDYSQRSRREILGYGDYLLGKLRLERKDKINELITEGKAEGYTYANDYLYILGKERPKAAEASEEISKDKLRRQRVEQIEVLEKQAQELRKRFVRDFSGGHLSLLIGGLLDSTVDFEYISDDELKEYLNISVGEGLSIRKTDEYKYMMKRHPEVVLLAALAVSYEEEAELHDWFGEYTENEYLADWYRILTGLGYQMSDDEKALLDGSHECFKEEEK